MRILWFPLLASLTAACLTGCNKQNENSGSAQHHVAAQYKSSIAGSHAWKGTERFIQPGIQDTTRRLADTSFVVSYVNDSILRIGARELPYVQTVNKIEGDEVWFRTFDNASKMQYRVIYNIQGDYLEFVGEAASVVSWYTIKYSTQ